MEEGAQLVAYQLVSIATRSGVLRGVEKMMHV
jgi:hypothetical protein